jgi:allophanate hydrolase subunit 2
LSKRDDPAVRRDRGATVSVGQRRVDRRPKLNGEAISSWRSYAVKAGDVVSFGYIESGARVYLAAAGGIDVPAYVGSRATYTLCALGGFEGRALQTGDVVPIGGGVEGTPGAELPENLRPRIDGDI